MFSRMKVNEGKEQMYTRSIADNINMKLK